MQIFFLWNVIVHSLLGMTIKGAIRYQSVTAHVYYKLGIATSISSICKSCVAGETNTYYHDDKYSCSFPAMINECRMAFQQCSVGQKAHDFPFEFFQVQPTNSVRHTI